MTNTPQSVPRLLVAIVLAAATMACSPATPAQKAAQAVEDASDARAKSIRESFDNSANAIRSQASEIRDRAKVATDFDKSVLKTRAEALDKEATLVAEHGRAKADAERADGESKAKAIKAQ